MTTSTWDHTITCDTEGCTESHNSRTTWPPPPDHDHEAVHANAGWTIDPKTGLRSCATHSQGAKP